MMTHFNFSRRLIRAINLLSIVLFTFSIYKVNAQCPASSGQIKGIVFEDKDNNGTKDINENVLNGILVSVVDEAGSVAGSTSTDIDGLYTISSLVDGKKYRVVFSHPNTLMSSLVGTNSATSVQFITAPSCTASLGLLSNSAKCASNPLLFGTCFVQGETTVNSTEATIIGVEHDFTPTSNVTKFASHGETGSVWGMAWKSSSNELFSSAFVKMYSGLSYGHDAILKTKINGTNYTTSKFVKLSELGINIAPLSGGSVSSCDYGDNVGRKGLGAIALSPGEDFLYTIDIAGRRLVKIATTNPTAANTTTYAIPDPGSTGEYYPFALKYYEGKLYIGVTYTVIESGTSQSSGAVMTFDLQNNTFNTVFTTDYLIGYWRDSKPDSIGTQHWLTDIDFTDDKNMLISLTDRIGHRYCKIPSNRLDHQFPDLLMVWNDNGTWKLENNGSAGSLTGSGVGNGQGPGNGEFFGNDYWVANSAYHPEIALGSIYVMPGTNSVVATVFDPDLSSYSGGLHRYNTQNGNKINSIELYTTVTNPLFGKATGFGDFVGRCGLPSLQIGNYVWQDNDKDGIQDAGEPPVAGIKLYLHDENCNIIDSTITSNSGNYLFSNIKPLTQYYISLSSQIYDSQYGIINLANQTYNFASIVNGEAINNNASVSSLCGNKAIVSIYTTGTNHTFDIGVVPSTGFDLALKNELASTQLLRKNDIAEFKISIYNQGGIPATNIKIANYIPEGLMFNPAENTQWTLSGTIAQTTLPGILLPGQSTTVNIKLRLMSSDRSKIIDRAEIVSAQDYRGLYPDDIDSKADNISNNDKGGVIHSDTDNLLSDNGTLDEDDEDPATPAVADLALKQVADAECFYSGDCANITVTVYNQGNVTIDGYKITNYLNSELALNPSSSEWNNVSGNLVYTSNSALLPGQSHNVLLSLCVHSSVRTAQVVNYSEISEFTALGTITNIDYDSNPDNNKSNDVGGNPNTVQDNYVNGTSTTEEDDHDPVLIGVKYVDLALKLTTTKRRVSSNENVCFNITVYNQGSEPISELDLVDYIPAGLTLQDTRWTVNNGFATKKIVFPQGFLPGQTHNQEICFVTEDMSNRFYLVNYAEISAANDMCLQPVGSKDIDSYADNIRTNDIGGRPQTETDNLVTAASPIDEDDQDPAILINYLSNSGSCQCLRNATNSSNGQFLQEIKIRGPKGMTWFIEQVNDLYSITSPAPPALPIPFITGPTGFKLTEVSVDSVTSDYELVGIFEDGKTFQIVLRSTDDDFERITGGGCAYVPTTVTGPAALCSASTKEYSVPVIPNGYSVSVTGGTIVASTADSSKISIAWGPTPGTYPVVFKAKSTTQCLEPGLLNVSIGSASQSLACKQDIQISLDENCDVEITPSMIIAGNLVPDAPYNITILDENNNMMPSNSVNHTHEGQTFMVKLFEGCSGNTCWGRIHVEDKLGPTIQCKDTVELTCFNFMEYPGPLANDNCTVIDKLVVLDSSSILLNCHPKYNMFVHKSYVAMDMHGNKSSVCKQVLAVKRIEMDSIKFPKDIEMANAFSCGGFTPDKDNHPIPAEAGIPTIRGRKLFPSFDRACNVAAAYTDLDHGIVGNCVRKISRIWTVYEGWCTLGVIKSDTQTIIIADTKAPTFTCPQNITVSASNDNCSGIVNLPAITNIKDDCSPLSDITINIQTPNGLIQSNGGTTILPAQNNNHRIVYKVSDKCGKVDSCVVMVKVEDKTAPVMVCHSGLTVSINSSGNGYIYANTIDDGSFDACGIDSFKVRRLDSGNPCGDTLGFGNIAYFCCADANKNVMVELRAWDRSGNSNSCMVNIAIQDKTIPTITCPPNDSISCEESYSLNNLSRFGNATVQDECNATITSTAVEIPGICRTGRIERTFTATDGTNSVTCNQTIKIIRITDSIKVVWPSDVTTVNRCSGNALHPDSLPIGSRRPIITQGICDQVGSSFKDFGPISFDNGRGSCFIIRRQWTVIDWCSKDEPGYEPLVYEQLITGTNTIDPAITLDTVETSVCTAQDNCNNAPVKLIASSKDDCTAAADLEWRYEIDLDFNGTFTPDITNNGKGNRIIASGTYKTGNHKIRFTVEDLCGNQVSRDHDFTVRNCNKPVAVCKPGASISLTQMNINGQLNRMACLNVATLNASSSHPCNEPLTYSYTTNTRDSVICFTCMDIGNRTVTLFATDRFGNQSSCNTVVQVQNNDASQVSITSNVDSVCPGAPVTLTAVGTGSILWSTGQTTRTITVNPTSSTTYTLSVTSTVDNCTLMANKTIIVRDTPTVNITSSLPNGNNFNLCGGGSIILSATGGGTYRWSNPGNSTTSSITVNPSASTSFTVTVTNSFGCTSRATRLVNVIPVSTNILLASTSGAAICTGQSTRLSVTNLLPGTTYSYAWSNGATTDTIRVNPSTNTTYVVTVTNSAGCTVTSSATVTVNPLPIVNITSLDSICSGDSISLTATSGFSSYLWTPGNNTTSSIRVRPNVGVTSYSVRVTNSNGCVNTATKNIKVNTRPTAVITGDTFICSGNSTVLKASGGNSYLWSTTQTTDSIIVSPTINTTYNVTVTSSATGCTSVATRTVVVGTRPTINFSGNTGICAGDTARITASGGNTYTWSNGQTGPLLVVSPSSSQSYSVTVSSGNNCSNVNTVNITVTPKPVISINNPPAICAGSSTVLRVTGGTSSSTFAWSPGTSNRDTLLVSPTTSTTYTVSVTTAGCQTTATRTVSVNPLPIPVVTASPSTICAGDSTTLTVSGAGTGGFYTWLTPGVTPSGATSVRVAPNTTTTYSVRVTNVNGCSSTGTVIVTVNQRPVVNISPNPAEICPGGTVTLRATGGGTYLWSTGTPNNRDSIVVSANGTYTVTVTSSAGCTTSASRVVSTKANPTITITSNKSTVCLGDSALLTVNGELAGSSYAWSIAGVGNNKTITVKPTTNTTYSVTVTTLGGCTSSARITLEVNTNNAPVASCNNPTIYINASGEANITTADINNGSTAGCAGGTPSLSLSRTQFFCNDLANPTPDTTVLTVTANGLTSRCTATITLRDTTKPTIVCPNNTTIPCTEFVSIAALPQPNVTENCGLFRLITTILDSTNSCRVGSITRIFSARDTFGNMSAPCTTKVTITSSGGLVASNITFPRDTSLVTCTNLAPTILGTPQLNVTSNACRKIGISFTDRRINVISPCNYTIARTWTVSDSCQFVTGTNNGIFVDTQFIQVRDTTAPVISGYNSVFFASAECPALVTISDANVSITDCNLATISHNAPQAINPNTKNISGYYPPGTTIVTVTATDSCGNSRSVNVTVIVQLNPSSDTSFNCVKLHKQIQDTRTVTIRASEYIGGVIGACKEDFAYSFSPTDISDSTKTYGCNFLGASGNIIYFFAGNRLVSQCTAAISITDPFGFCRGNIFRVNGNISTEENQPVEKVNLILEGTDLDKIDSDENGNFQLPEMNSSSYMLKPKKDDGILEGINTLDLIMIQRHLLGLSKLSSPYKIIAADINNDKKISVTDLVELRKNLLGLSNHFTNNDSWKLIDKNYNFSNPSNPLSENYPTFYELIDPTGEIEVNFIGVKIGDVNGSWVAKRNNLKLSNASIFIKNELLKKDQEINIPISVKGVKTLDGMQFTLDIRQLENISVTSEVLSDKEYFYSIKNDKLFIIVSADKAISNMENILTIKATVSKDMHTSEAIKLDEKQLSSQIYSDLLPLETKIEWKTDQLFSVSQNTPNPWSDLTKFTYNLPSSGEVKFTVSDVKGRVIHTEKINGNQGNNTYELRPDILKNMTGVFFYQFQFAEHTQHGKMIRVN